MGREWYDPASWLLQYVTDDVCENYEGSLKFEIDSKQLNFLLKAKPCLIAKIFW